MSLYSVWKQINDKGFTKLEESKEYTSPSSPVYLKKGRRFPEDGVYLDKWMHMNKGRSYVRVVVPSAEDLIAFLSDLRRLKPSKIQFLTVSSGV